LHFVPKLACLKTDTLTNRHHVNDSTFGDLDSIR